MASNPVEIPITTQFGGSIACNSHALFYQRVTLQVAGDTVVFSGSGENVAMTTQDGSISYDLPPSRQGYSITALFQYSTSGPNGVFANANAVNDPIDSPPFIFVTSEDSADNDNNDSYLTIYCAQEKTK